MFLLLLLQQVELMPGSGVYIKRSTYNQLQFIDKGSKLVRKLVREIFPDVHLLASSSCMGKGETSAGLDRHKVEVIKGVYHFELFNSFRLIRQGSFLGVRSLDESSVSLV